MSDKEKQRFQLMADRDKQRFDDEMKSYEGPFGGRVTKKKQVKDPNAPKRSLSAFFWWELVKLISWTLCKYLNVSRFCQDLRQQVKEQHPEYTLGEIAKELGRRWGQMDEATKAQYAARAVKDKARYERVSSILANYKVRQLTLLTRICKPIDKCKVVLPLPTVKCIPTLFPHMPTHTTLSNMHTSPKATCPFIKLPPF